MSHPEISIIMPVFNGERYIAESIQSVLKQTFENWELLIIDDGSTDSTRTVVGQFKDPRIHYTDIPHCGYDGAVRNHGLRQAAGRYIAFLDADDLYLPDALEVRFQYLEAHADCTAVYGFYELIDELGNPPLFNHCRLQQTADNESYMTQEARVNWHNILTGNTSTFLQGLMLRRETVERIGFFEEDLLISSDHVYFIRLYADCLSGVYPLPQKIFQYRVHTQSLTRNDARFQQTVQSYPAIFERFFSVPGVPAFSREQRSHICGQIIRNAIRGRVNTGQKRWARKLIQFACRTQWIRKQDALKYCVPYYSRILLPNGLETIVYKAFQALKGYRSQGARKGEQHAFS